MNFEPTLNQDSTELLRRAVNDGIIVPGRDYSTWKTSHVAKAAMKYAVMNARPTNDLDWYGPQASLKTLVNRWDQKLFLLDQTRYNLIEVGRIVVPFRHVGYLRSISQILVESTGSFYPTSSEFWGVPFQSVSDVDNFRWFFRTEPFYGPQPGTYNFSSAIAFVPENILPGQPFSELDHITGIWYPPHNSGIKVDLLIGEGTMLRFFAYTPPTPNFEFSVGSRLEAKIQSSLCKEAAYQERVR